MGAASGIKIGAATHEQSARKANGSVPRLASAFQPACSTAAASTSASAPPVIGRRPRAESRSAPGYPGRFRASGGVGGHVGAPHVHKSRTRGNAQLGEGGGERLHHTPHVAPRERAHVV